MENPDDRERTRETPKDPALQDDATRDGMIERNRQAAAETRANDPSIAERLRAKLKRLQDDDPNVYPLV